MTLPYRPDNLGRIISSWVITADSYCSELVPNLGGCHYIVSPLFWGTISKPATWQTVLIGQALPVPAIESYSYAMSTFSVESHATGGSRRLPVPQK